jgi:hypothetical protein
MHPIQQTHAMSDHAFLIKFFLPPYFSARRLCGKGLGPISTFWPITNEDLEPLTQQVGLASRSKAAPYYILNT